MGLYYLCIFGKKNKHIFIFYVYSLVLRLNKWTNQNI